MLHKYTDRNLRPSRDGRTVYPIGLEAQPLEGSIIYQRPKQVPMKPKPVAETKEYTSGFSLATPEPEFSRS